MSNIIKPKLYLTCKDCNNNHLIVAMSDKNELMIICPNCNHLMAIFDNLPLDKDLKIKDEEINKNMMN